MISTITHKKTSTSIQAPIGGAPGIAFRSARLAKSGLLPTRARRVRSAAACRRRGDRDEDRNEGDEYEQEQDDAGIRLCHKRDG